MADKQEPTAGEHFYSEIQRAAQDLARHEQTYRVAFEHLEVAVAMYLGDPIGDTKVLKRASKTAQKMVKRVREE